MRSWVLFLMVVATKNIHPTLLLFASDYANDKIFCWVQSILHEYVIKVTQPWQTSTILSFFNQPFLTCCIDYSKEIQVSIFWFIIPCPLSIFRWKIDFLSFRASQTAEWQARKYFQLPSWFLQLLLAQQ